MNLSLTRRTKLRLVIYGNNIQIFILFFKITMFEKYLSFLGSTLIINSVYSKAHLVAQYLYHIYKHYIAI